MIQVRNILGAIGVVAIIVAVSGCNAIQDNVTKKSASQLATPTAVSVNSAMPDVKDCPPGY